MRTLDSFAAAALAAIDFTDQDEHHIARRVYDIAEAMMAESQKRQGFQATCESPVVAAVAPNFTGSVVYRETDGTLYREPILLVAVCDDGTVRYKIHDTDPAGDDGTCATATKNFVAVEWEVPIVSEPRR